jgi:hypothetical protein
MASDVQRGPRMRCGKGSLMSLILPLFETVALANSLRALPQERESQESSLLRTTRLCYAKLYLPL